MKDIVEVNGDNYLCAGKDSDEARELYRKKFGKEPEIVMTVENKFYAGPVEG